MKHLQQLRGRISEIIVPSGDVISPEFETSVPSDEAPCPEHPDWKPERRLATQPRAPQCPHCLAESAQARRHTGSSSERVNNPRGTTEATFGQDYRRVNAALEAYQERQASRPGYVVSGSEEERRALGIIEDLRDEEKDRDRRKSGRVCIERIEGNRIVQYVAHRCVPGLVRREV